MSGDTLTPSPERFEFGENWRNFSALLTEERVRDAELSLASMLHLDNLRGRSFLDIGCGSGLFSLAAARMGVGRIHSFDYDANSVACTAAVKEQFFVTKEDWTIERGDITDPAYVRNLGTFDIVYAWGVLHHTGAMWTAIANACARVAPGGVFFLSIYNSQGRRSELWRDIKRVYNRLPRRLRHPYAVLVTMPMQVRAFALATLTLRPGDYLRSWVSSRERGMSRWHDLIDWVGGYPYEFAKPEEVFRFCRDRGFVLTELTTKGRGLGCNEFVFHRGWDKQGPSELIRPEGASNM
jgi:2-polyprenyl-3-methyl-5-hydroxy-6-metoxy-1,4-benzoquinol methylase